MPPLNEGETYIGAVIAPDGTGNHVILLPGDQDDASWEVQMEWARTIGGDLPDRVEQALLFRDHKAAFKETWYWSNTQHADYADYAWCQNFSHGHQNYNLKSVRLRARAVRRVAI